jgi:phage tail-like protein
MPPPATKAPTPQAGAQPGTFAELVRNYNFKLMFLPDIPEGHFTECSGFSVRVNTTPYREHGNSQIVHQLPGSVEYSSVTLRYGLTKSKDLWEWMQKSVKGTVERRDINILMLGTDGISESLRYTCHGAFPCAWTSAPLDAMSTLVAIESIELKFDYVERM